MSHRTPLLPDTEGLSFVEYLIVLCVVALLGFGAWRAFGSALALSTGAAGDDVGKISKATTVSSAASRTAAAQSGTATAGSAGGALTGGTQGIGPERPTVSTGAASGALVEGGSPDGTEGGGVRDSVAIVQVPGASSGATGSELGSGPSQTSNDPGAAGGFTAALLESPGGRGVLTVLAFRGGVGEGAEEHVGGAWQALKQAASHPIKTGKAVGVAVGRILEMPVEDAAAAAWTALRSGVARAYSTCTEGTARGCGLMAGGVVASIGMDSIPGVRALKTAVQAARIAHRMDFPETTVQRMIREDQAHPRPERHNRYSGGVREEPTPWMQSQFRQVVEEVRDGHAGPSANPDDVAAYLQREWRRSEEVGVMMEAMGARSRRAPIDSLPLTSPVIAHNIGELISTRLFIDKVREWRKNPLHDANGHPVEVPAWVEEMRLDTMNREMATPRVEVGVLNPHIAAGLGRSGPPDVYAQAIHNLSNHNRANAIADRWNRAGLTDPDLQPEQIEQLASRINRMRRPTDGTPPVSFEQIEVRLVGEAGVRRMPRSAESSIYAGLRAQRRIEQGD